MMFIIYFLVGLCASILGSLAGLGGGVIIKPVLDTLGDYHVSTISVLSSATVFSMATVSLIYAAKRGATVNGKTSLMLAIGSIFGGVFGESGFNLLIEHVYTAKFMALIQSIMLALLMLVILILVKNKENMKALQMKGAWITVAVGFSLGVISSFLGIGGGPLNVAVLYILFSMNAKETMINSIFIIFFSQLSTLITVSVTTGLGAYDLSMLLYMIPGAIFGGMIGTTLLKKVTDSQVIKIFNVTIVVIICINIYNVIRYFI